MSNSDAFIFGFDLTKLSRPAALLTILSAMTALSACASVKLVPEETRMGLAVDSDSTVKSERQALMSATRHLDDTPWPEVTEQSIGERMVAVLFGKEQEEEVMTRDEALAIYVAELAATGNPSDTLKAHADACLRNARLVAKSGQFAAYAINPDTDDITVLEDAITDIRFNRDMYLAAFKRLKSEGHEVDMTAMEEIRDAFSQTIRDIGATADMVADRANQDGRSSMLAASPRPDIKPKAE